ncbi:adenosylcobinamide-phosphate synthase CbiB [Paracoccus sp. Z330]|uniref:Cobalamin biosynthesis protein CobD n=1 Tax=Paracoccus onchidii TaxID=3017813 RepID=A0ABT4ZEW2_9RHOB|nr:adenosylcobinamide-phosphate synthase CbiB [Paracoccus onchidii]MDB6177860.1 adenosylcobinamide-phosphate synthase CbiB [Paracoccus onchidii]
MTILTALIALLLDVAIGWPDRLFRKIGHPVVWLGAVISWLDHRLNSGAHRAIRGSLVSLAVIGAALLPAIALQVALGRAVSGHMFLGPILAGIVAWPLIAARSLDEHVRAVALALERKDITSARQATSMIVGRDVSAATEAELSRAAIESLAENASDGVIAPLFWACVAGLPGVAAYKAINTLDSMIGHRTPRHQAFGRFAARLDDVANLIPARLTALLIVLASGKTRWAGLRRDAIRHRSPNAGWPETAMAKALDIRLSGPRVYADRVANEPWLNGKAKDPDAHTVAQALRLYRRAMILAAILMAGVFLITR